MMGIYQDIKDKISDVLI